LRITLPTIPPLTSFLNAAIHAAFYPGSILGLGVLPAPRASDFAVAATTATTQLLQDGCDYNGKPPTYGEQLMPLSREDRKIRAIVPYQEQRDYAVPNCEESPLTNSEKKICTQ
jgi:hypothetical protein